MARARTRATTPANTQPLAQVFFVSEASDLDAETSQLFDKMLESIGLNRQGIHFVELTEDVSPLVKDLETHHPKLIVALGKFPVQVLLGSEEPISKLRGHFTMYKQTRLLPTYHPSYLLKHPSSKKESWEDLQKIASELGLTVQKRKVTR